MQNKGRKRFVWVTLLGVGMTFASCLFGGDVFWSGATSQNWHTPSNWSSGSVPTNGDTAVIDPAQQAVTRWDFQLTNDAEVAGIRFTNLTQTVSGSASGKFALSLGDEGVSVSGAAVTLALPCVVAAPQVWAVTTGAELIHSGELRGSAKIAKTGEGRAWLMGKSVFSGSYQVNEGVLKGVSEYSMPVADGLNVWLDASAIATIITNSAGAITVWSNRVGTSVMTPVDGGGPLWVANAVRGKPAARFNSADSNGLVMHSGYANNTNVVTVFVVTQRRGKQGASFAGILSIFKDGEMDYNTSTGTVFFRFGSNTTPAYTLFCDRDNVTKAGQIHVSRETPVCLMARYDGQSLALVQDGVLPGSVNTHAKLTQSFDADRLILGNRPMSNYAYPFDGDVSEVLIYNRVLTVAEEQQVFAYLRQKWQRPVTLETVLSEASLWFDAAQPEMIVTNTFGGVVAWSNLVSESTLTPLTNATPLFVNQSVNGLPAVRFGKDLNNGLKTTGGYWNRGKALTVFVSLVPHASQSRYAGVVSVVGLGNDYNAAANAVAIYTSDFMQRRWGAHRQNNVLSEAILIPDQSSFLMSHFDGSAHKFSLNGTVLGAPVVSDQTFNAQVLYLGTRCYETAVPPTFNGDIQEVIVYNRTLSSVEENLINEYLDKKWRKVDDLDILLADAAVHLDASEAMSVVTNAAGQVVTWSNLTSDAVMTVPTEHGCVGPQWVAGAMNNRPVMRFDNLQTNGLFMQSGYTNIEAGLTAFVLLRRMNLITWAGILSAYNASKINDWGNTASVVLLQADDSSYKYTLYSHRVNHLGSVADIPYNEPVCLMSAFDGLKHTIAVNGVSASTAVSSGLFDANRLCLGVRWCNGTMRYHFSGDIAEVLVYNRSLSSEETARINDHMREKWQQSPSDTLEGLLSSAQLWLDASVSDTLTTNESGLVTFWSNLVVNTPVALIPHVGGTGPAIIANGMNGKTVLRFNKDAGATQGLMVSQGFALTNAAATAIMVMSRRESQTSYARVLTVWKDDLPDHNTTEGGIFVHMPFATSCAGHRANARKSVYSPLPEETPVCLISRYDGEAHRMIRDGEVLCAPVQSAGRFNANRLSLGCNSGAIEPFNGDIAEVLLFDYALTPDQYQMIATYLKDKWINSFAGTPVGALQNVSSIEVGFGSELDVRDVAGFAVQSNGVLFGAGTVLGNVTVRGGGRIQAVSDGDGVLNVAGDLIFQPDSTVVLDYTGGARPLISVTGLLLLPTQMTYAATNITQITGSAKVPVLQGDAWSDGSGEQPVPGAWSLLGGSGANSFELDDSIHRVNLLFVRGTKITIL